MRPEDRFLWYIFFRFLFVRRFLSSVSSCFGFVLVFNCFSFALVLVVFLVLCYFYFLFIQLVFLRFFHVIVLFFCCLLLRTYVRAFFPFSCSFSHCRLFFVRVAVLPRVWPCSASSLPLSGGGGNRCWRELSMIPRKWWRRCRSGFYGRQKINLLSLRRTAELTHQTDRSSTDKSSTDRSSTDRSSADESSTDRSSTDTSYINYR